MTKQLTSLLLSAVFSAAALAQLPAETIPSNQSLPESYPDSWMFAHDANFASLVTGRVVIFDPAADTLEYKGALDASQFATFIESSTRPELYVAESHYARTTRGQRTDTVTIYDKASLKQIDEILLPSNKRAQIVTNKFATRLVDNDNYLLVFAFTPATSVYVIDVASRKVISEVPVPGCSMIYPAGQRGFVSLCGNGSILHVSLNKDGSIEKQEKIEGVFDPSADPLFDKPTYVGDTAYFPSFKGQMLPIKMANKIQVQKPWSLLNDADKNEGWRPSGWQIASSDKERNLYMLMRKNSGNGDHKTGGNELWVYDVKRAKRTQRIALKTDGFSVEVNKKSGLIVVTNINMGIDVYNLSGELQREISGIGAMPIILHAKR